MWLVAVGNVIDGTVMYGPFEDRESAGDWAALTQFGKDWHVVKAESPVPEGVKDAQAKVPNVRC